MIAPISLYEKENDMKNDIVIDVSEHQGVIDWDKAWKSGKFKAAILRIGYGGDYTNQDDKQFANNVRACERLGIPYGIYLYSYAYNNSLINGEIQHTLRLLSGHKPQYPVYLDLEEARYAGYFRTAAQKYCKALNDAGYMAGIYSGISYWNNQLKGVNSWTKWVPSYGSNVGGKMYDWAKPSIGADYDAWQYTSTGSVPGIKSSGLDVSVFYTDFKSSKDDAGSSVSDKTTTKPVQRKEIAVILMEHLVEDANHGYSQRNRSGNGQGFCYVTVNGNIYSVAKGDRDCSSAICDVFRQAGIDIGAATYTGNMRSNFVKSGNFRWHPMSGGRCTDGYVPKRGDVALNERNHTAMFKDSKTLMEFSISETGGIDGKSGDQLQRGDNYYTGESHYKKFYNYPWDGVLECINTETEKGGNVASAPTVSEDDPSKIPHIIYGIKTLHHGIRPDITDRTKTGGYKNDAVVGIKIGVTMGQVKYRVHCLNKGWLGKITGADWNDYNNGWAGNGIDPIDAIQIYYTTDRNKTDGKWYEAVYQVKAADKSKWYMNIHDTDWSNGDGNGTSGAFGHPFTKINMHLQKGN